MSYEALINHQVNDQMSALMGKECRPDSWPKQLWESEKKFLFFFDFFLWKILVGTN